MCVCVVGDEGWRWEVRVWGGGWGAEYEFGSDDNLLPGMRELCA